MTLNQLEKGQIATITGIVADEVSQNRLNSMGVIKGKEIKLRNKAPFGDPKIYSLMGYELTLRNQDAKMVMIKTS
ncbi:MAG: ferrous iron transport protein A [Magnetococcales bacterium]|nr:ferrous iron transport protein A [Magnetococcales bacterium]